VYFTDRKHHTHIKIIASIHFLSIISALVMRYTIQCSCTANCTCQEMLINTSAQATGSIDTSVGTAARLWVGQPRYWDLIPSRRKRDFLFYALPSLALVATQPSEQWLPCAVSLGGT
jgi:hypothetical protein